MSRFFPLVLLALAFGETAEAQAETSPDASLRVMTLPEALVYADQHMPSLRLARARVESAKAAVQVPKAAWLPRVGMLFELLGSTSNNTAASIISSGVIDLPRIGGTKAITSSDLTPGDLTPYPSSLAGIGVEQEIFDFGRISSLTKVQEALVDVERFRAESDQLDVELAVREAYFSVLGAKGLAEVAEAQKKRSAAQHDFVSGGIQSKLTAPSDLARVDAELARAEVAVVRARSGVELAQGVLAATLGFDGLRVDASPIDPAGSALPDLKLAIDQAGSRDPVIAQVASQLRAQEAQTSAIGAERRPNLYLSSALSVRASGAPLTGDAGSFGAGFLPEVPNYDVGLVLTVPIFDGVVRARERVSRAREVELHSAVDEAHRQEALAIERAYYAVKASEVTLPALSRARDAAEEAFQQAKARFEQGLGSSLEVTDAEGTLAEAETQLSLGKFDLLRARAIFTRSISEP